jgi:hypothetical protein
MAQRSMKLPTISSVRPWLAVTDGVCLADPSERVAPAGEPEAPLEVEFVGINEDEQRAALAAFPGGSRFVLKSRRH